MWSKNVFQNKAAIECLAFFFFSICFLLRKHNYDNKETHSFPLFCSLAFMVITTESHLSEVLCEKAESFIKLPLYQCRAACFFLIITHRKKPPACVARAHTVMCPGGYWGEDANTWFGDWIKYPSLSNLININHEV